MNANNNAEVMVAAYDVSSSTSDQEPIDEQPVGQGRRASTQYLNASVLRPSWAPRFLASASKSIYGRGERKAVKASCLDRGDRDPFNGSSSRHKGVRRVLRILR